MKPACPENTQAWMDEGASLWDTWGKNRLGVYQGFRKGKAGCPMTLWDLLWAELEESSPSKGLGVHFLLLREEEDAIEAMGMMEVRGKEEQRVADWLEGKRKETRNGRFGEIKRLCKVRIQKAVGGDNMWEDTPIAKDLIQRERSY